MQHILVLQFLLWLGGSLSRGCTSCVRLGGRWGCSWGRCARACWRDHGLFFRSVVVFLSPGLCFASHLLFFLFKHSLLFFLNLEVDAERDLAFEMKWMNSTLFGLIQKLYQPSALQSEKQGAYPQTSISGCPEEVTVLAVLSWFDFQHFNIILVRIVKFKTAALYLQCCLTEKPC